MPHLSILAINARLCSSSSKHSLDAELLKAIFSSVLSLVLNSFLPIGKQPTSAEESHSDDEIKTSI